jgi:hypothetical protein
MTDFLEAQRSPARHVLLVVLLSAVLTLFVLVVVLPNLWYGVNDISDIPVYQKYAHKMAKGMQPFTALFPVEYPPLALPLFRLPPRPDHFGIYAYWFRFSMGTVTMIAAVLTAVAAARLWPQGLRAYRAAALFPLGVALTGVIILNRYDVAVALVIAALAVCLVERWYVAAAVVLGLGFALKMTPAAMLPLVLILAGPPRRWLWPIAAFTVAAVAPFVQYVITSPIGVWYVFRYHLERPLQIESVLGTPMLLGQLLGAEWAAYGFSHGSHRLIAPGAGVAAAASGALTLLAVLGVYLLVWRRRSRLLEAPQEQVLAVLCLILALMTFSKVLSPQFIIWLLPAWALVAARDRLLGVVGGLVLLLTHIEFPSLYGRLLTMEADALAVVVARNVLLFAFFALAVWRLWMLPGKTGEAPDPASGADVAAAPGEGRAAPAAD